MTMGWACFSCEKVRSSINPGDEGRLLWTSGLGSESPFQPSASFSLQPFPHPEIGHYLCVKAQRLPGKITFPAFSLRAFPLSPHPSEPLQRSPERCSESDLRAGAAKGEFSRVESTNFGVLCDSNY